MKNKLLSYFSAFFHTTLDLLSIGETKAIPWMLNKFKGKELLEIGAKLTYYYFAIFLLFFGWKIPFLIFKPLNEIGDFLAGVFGPIAFGWLIIGYLMQNKELQYNRLSLDSQINELKRSINISEKNLYIQEKNAEERREEIRIKSTPMFKVKAIYEDISMLEIKKTLVIPVHNIGAKITSVRLIKTFKSKGVLCEVDVWDRNSEEEIVLDLSDYDYGFHIGLEGERAFEFEKIDLEYTDLRGKRMKAYLSVYLVFTVHGRKFTANFYEVNDELITVELD